MAHLQAAEMTHDDEVETLSRKGPPKWRSSRFILAYLVSLGMVVMFMQRVCFSLAIVCMVNHTALDLNRHSLKTSLLENVSFKIYNDTFQAPAFDSGNVELSWIDLQTETPRQQPNGTKTVADGQQCVRGADNLPSEKEDGPFVWDKDMQGLLLGAMFWSYLVTQVPAGYVFYYAGPRLTVGVSMTLMSVFTMLCHPAAFWSPWAVFALRNGIGACASFTVASMFALWGKWAPQSERATLINIAFSGQNFAVAVVFPFSALLCKYGFAGGWPSVYYVHGALGLVWCVAWFILVSDSPEDHKRIDPRERQYILENRVRAHTKGDKIRIPWLQILTSLPFWATVAAQFTFTWGFFLFSSNLPLYLNEVMNFDIKSNGVYSMLPYLLHMIVVLLSGFSSDAIVRKKLLNVFWARRLYAVLSYLIPAILLLIMSFLDCTQVAAVITLLVLSVGLMGFAFSCFLVNFYDIGGRFAVAIQSVSTSIACIPGIVTPYVVAEVTKEKTREQWQTVFLITCGIFLFGTTFFCLFAKTTVQKWALYDLTLTQEQPVVLDDIRKNDTLTSTGYDEVQRTHVIAGYDEIPQFDRDHIDHVTCQQIDDAENISSTESKNV